MKETKIVKVDPYEPEPRLIREAASVISRGGLVVFPTETVYGLGANAISEEAVRNIFEAKGRPTDNPIIVHIHDESWLSELVCDVPDRAWKLIKRFWPGPLTIVLKKSAKVPYITTAGLETVGIRMPSHPVANMLIRESGVPIAAPSANLSGSPSPTTFKHAFVDMYGRVDIIIDGGKTPIGVESTVIDVSVDPPELLRPGGISLEELRECLGEVRVHRSVREGIMVNDESRSPGMKHRHYAPNAKMVVIEGKLNDIKHKIDELIKQFKRSGLKIGILSLSGNMYKADVIKVVGKPYDLKSIASNLFESIREVDAKGVDVIIAEGIETKEIGLAIMDRLRKASGGHVIKV